LKTAVERKAMLTPLLTMLTPEPDALYIAAMSNDLGNERFEIELKRLEKRLDELVGICKKLQDENVSLRNRQDMLTSERASLLQKNEQVRGRVEAMITRLKAMEQTS
jgi:cell division protein ZapB